MIAALELAWPVFGWMRHTMLPDGENCYLLRGGILQLAPLAGDVRTEAVVGLVAAVHVPDVPLGCHQLVDVVWG